MTFRVAINEPCLLGELASALAAGDCSVRPVSDRALEVTSVVRRGSHVSEAELLFFLRAWADANGGVDLVFL